MPIGEVKDIYAMDGEGHPMWVTVEASFGMGDKRRVFIPLARLKEEDGELRVPYSKAHVQNTPEVEDEDRISAKCERKLRDHYGIDRADQELRDDNKSYATLVPAEDEGEAQLVQDVDKLETPDADRRTDETKERLHDPGSGETRDVDAGAIADENTRDGSDDAEGESDDAKGESDDDTKPGGEEDEEPSREGGEKD